MAAKFWWGSTERKRKILWCKWEVLCKSKDRGGLGFKDLELFNQTLLAKQAKLGGQPSFVWRGLLWGREIIEKGSRWRIGSGMNVRIIEDRWIPRPTSFKCLIDPIIPEGLRVVDLRMGSGEWDVSFIPHHFCVDDMKLIMGLPIGSLNSLDKHIWHYTTNGEYSVRSGYKVAVELRDNAESSDMGRLKQWWKLLWGLRISPKIQHFLWKLCNNCLPTTKAVNRRGLKDDVIGCCRCGVWKENEDWYNAIWGCTHVKNLWQLSGFSKVIKKTRQENPVDFLSRVDKLMTMDKFEMFIVLAWQSWYLWNCVLHNTFVPSHTSVLEWSANYIHQFWDINAERRYSTVEKSCVWQPPPINQVLINVDAVVDSKGGCCSYGAIARDHNGSVLVAAGEYIPRPYSALVAELYAIKFGAEVIRRSRMNNCIIESDCSMVVSMLDRPPESSGELDLIVEDIIVSLSHVGNPKVRFKKRSANKVAHVIARNVLIGKTTSLWDGEVPPMALACRSLSLCNCFCCNSWVIKKKN